MNGYACVRRLSDDREWEITPEQYAALALPGAGAPPNVSAGEYTNRQWLDAWNAHEIEAMLDDAFATPSKRLAFGDYALLPNGKLRLGTNSPRDVTLWPSGTPEATAAGRGFTGTNRNNFNLVGTRSAAIPLNLVGGIVSVR